MDGSGEAVTARWWPRVRLGGVELAAARLRAQAVAWRRCLQHKSLGWRRWAWASGIKALEAWEARQAEGDVGGADTADGGGVRVGDAARKERHPTGGLGASAGWRELAWGAARPGPGRS